MLSFILEESSSGVVIFIANQSVNIHFTYCLDPGGALNCHIKLNGEEVWRMRKTPEEFEEDLRRIVEEYSFEWDNDDEVFIYPRMSFFDDQRASALQGKETVYDFEDITREGIKGYSNLIRRRLKNLGRDEVLVGYSEKYPESMVFIMPNHQGFEVPLTIEEGIFSILPPFIGFIKFIELAEKQGCLDNFDSPEVEREIRGLMVRLEFEEPKHR